MDPVTFQYYCDHAAEVAERYDSAPSCVEPYLRQAFLPGTRVLDVGAGSGRDLDVLLEMGCDAYGVEPCDELRRIAVAKRPRLAGRLEPGWLPDHPNPFGGRFAGILCSAVLMHLTRGEIFDAAVALKDCLDDNGRLLLSVPCDRPGINAEHRDEHGRLFTPLHVGYLQLLFERLGFDLIGRWTSQDGLSRAGYSWHVLLFQIRHAGSLRPVDQIEGILTRDRKTATYKLALFRALSEIAVTQFEQARWRSDGSVGVPLDAVSERWIHYFWPIVTAPQFVPQIRGESPTSGKPIAFRAVLRELGTFYEGAGGLAAFSLDYRSRKLPPVAAEMLRRVQRSIAGTIVSGPVTYAGGALETGRVFGYDRATREVTMSPEIWRELSILGHWIQDAVVLRWAQLTADISKGTVRPSEVIDLLMTVPIPERDVWEAREVYASLPEKECVWTGQPLAGGFDVDHILPFSLWRNNDLWNLVPALPKVNARKSDRLPTRRLLSRRRDCLVSYWRVLREARQARFDHESCRLLGVSALPKDWESAVFASVSEAVEFTAIQRGCERWEP